MIALTKSVTHVPPTNTMTLTLLHVKIAHLAPDSAHMEDLDKLLLLPPFLTSIGIQTPKLASNLAAQKLTFLVLPDVLAEVTLMIE